MAETLVITPTEEQVARAHLAHHFDTPQQQFDSGKLGMWMFLATEMLLFSGLFCAYGVFRAMHPKYSNMPANTWTRYLALSMP